MLAAGPAPRPIPCYRPGSAAERKGFAQAEMPLPLSHTGQKPPHLVLTSGIKGLYHCLVQGWQVKGG